MKNAFYTLQLLFLSIFSTGMFAQPYFQRSDSIDVKIGSSYIKNAWAGGLNFVQTSAIDLNGDGIKDLVTFDRTGDKLRTFINHGTSNTVDYKYEPYYEGRFPEMHSWALMQDYNCDGKEDIFTYSKASGGIDIYKNVSTIGGGLQFQLVSLLQKSIYNPTRSNSTSSSIPDGGITNTWDGFSGAAGSFISQPITVSNANAGYWKITDVTINIVHPNASDLIVYLENPCGDRIRLIRNAGGTGDNFTNTNFSPYATHVIGSPGYDLTPFTGTYAPEAGAAAWSTITSSSCNPNGVWFLRIGDQASGNTGIIQSWSISFYSPNFTPFTLYSPANLYVSSVDIPALTDIDNDGDLDIVTFASTGSYIEYHENLSMDFYGNCDSLCYQVRNRCWGFASEDAMSNDYTLNDVCGVNVGNPGIAPDSTGPAAEESREERHSGSCQLCIDLDNDGDKEFIVGDVSFTNLTMLTNGGTPKVANMVAVDVAFPSNNASTSAVDMTLFPCAYYVDVNNDSIKDLIVSPNAPNSSENFNSEVYYKNTGTNSAPVFQYEQANLLQDNMIEVGEGAYPVFFDYDNDGLKDLFIGNYGYYNAAGMEHKIAQFKNTGTAGTPRFELITRDYNNFSAIGITNMVPAFGDLDGDGDADMVIGAFDGRLHYFQNIAPAGSTANFVLSVANMRNSSNRIIDVGDFAAPQIFDMDNDGKNDLVIGGKNGKMSYYHHTGSATSTVPVLDSVTNFFGNVKVNQPLYSTGWHHPFVFKDGGQTKIISGSQLGYLRLYEHIDGNLTGTFSLVDSMFLGSREGERSAPSGADINNDGYIDLVVGNYSGGVAFFKGTANLTTSNDIDTSPSWNIDAYPNPANSTVTIRINNDHSSTYSIELYNVMGQLIVSQKTSATNVLFSTDQLKQGMYVCKVNELDGYGTIKSSLAKRIVIQH